MLPCSLQVYKIKQLLGKQTIASLCDLKKRFRLLDNWAEGMYSLEETDTEHLADDLDDLEED
eukprot:5053175-Pleurochrysis_carterae.AAC.1